jgi:hypothetical protein
MNDVFLLLEELVHQLNLRLMEAVLAAVPAGARRRVQARRSPVALQLLHRKLIHGVR